MLDPGSSISNAGIHCTLEGIAGSFFIYEWQDINWFDQLHLATHNVQPWSEGIQRQHYSAFMWLWKTLFDCSWVVLQDYIILVVRKAMFKREDTVRIAATNAIVELIIAQSRRNEANLFEDSSSQPSSSQQPETHLEFGRSLFQELSGLLRRCLSQQVSLLSSCCTMQLSLFFISSKRYCPQHH
jgi:hypothetical protein